MNQESVEYNRRVNFPMEGTKCQVLQVMVSLNRGV